MTQTTPAPVSPRSDERTFRLLARTSLTVSLLGILVAVVVGVVALSQETEDANLGLVPVVLIGVPMLFPLALSATALRLRRPAPSAAFTLAALAAGVLAVGLVGVAGVFLPSLLG